jgi:hypothetical protein
MLRDTSLDTNVVTQEKKLRTAALKLTFHQPLIFCSFFLFFSSKIFLTAGTSFLFFFVLSFSLSLSLAPTQRPCTQDFGTKRFSNL